jgi:alpha-amylase
MKSISLSFQVHQSFRLKKYRFFDVGNDSYYYDDFENERKIRYAAENFYLPTNEILIGLLQKYRGRFKIAFSISGTAIDLFCLYAPEVIESFQRMADTEGVEFLCETYSHSLASLFCREEFIRQSRAHAQKIEVLFNQTPKVYTNTGLIYSDNIGEMVARMGFKAMITEGAKHILDWRSPNYLYQNPITPELKLLLSNNRLSEAIGFRFDNSDWQGWPGISSNFISLLNNIPQQEKLVNIFLDYKLAGKGQLKGSGIFNFLKSLPSTILEMTDYKFMNPSEISDQYTPVSEICIPEPVSRTDREEGDLSAWLDNELQEEALRKLYSVNDKIEYCHNSDLLKDWKYLQSLDHLYYMSSKFFSNQEDSSVINPYNNPYEAFMNYMNILDDFVIRLNHATKRALGRFTYTKSRELVKD